MVVTGEPGYKSKFEGLVENASPVGAGFVENVGGVNCEALPDDVESRSLLVEWCVKALWNPTRCTILEDGLTPCRQLRGS